MSCISGASPYSRGSEILPLSIDTAATAGEQRYTQSSGVPERPGKLRLNVRSEFASDGGAWPIPTHGPHTGSSMRTPPSTSWRETPDPAVAPRVWGQPGGALG